MEIEYDPRKAHANLSKHGISFEEAATALLDPMALAMEDAQSRSECRWIIMGLSERGRLLTVVYTIRGERVRLISARRSTRRERADYA